METGLISRSAQSSTDWISSAVAWDDNACSKRNAPVRERIDRLMKRKFIETYHTFDYLTLNNKNKYKNKGYEVTLNLQKCVCFIYI